MSDFIIGLQHLFEHKLIEKLIKGSTMKVKDLSRFDSFAEQSFLDNLTKKAIHFPLRFDREPVTQHETDISNVKINPRYTLPILSDSKTVEDGFEVVMAIQEGGGVSLISKVYREQMILPSITTEMASGTVAEGGLKSDLDPGKSLSLIHI